MLLIDLEVTAESAANFPYDSWEQVYQTNALYKLPWDTPKAHPLLVDLFEKHRPQSEAKALDLGCGTGASTRLLTSVGYNVDAWDVSETAIARARMLSKNSEYKAQFIIGNAISSALKKANAYDLILDFFFLHHVQEIDIPTYFSGIRRVLKPKGTYVVGVFVHDGSPFRRLSLFSTGEVIYWSRAEIQAQLGDGWQCHSETYGRAGKGFRQYPVGLFEFISSV